MPSKLPTSGDPIIDELYKSIRLLLRHSMSGNVPGSELMEQMQRLDKAFGKTWTSSTPEGSGYPRRPPRKK